MKDLNTRELNSPQLVGGQLFNDTNGVFYVMIDDKFYNVIASNDEMGWDHVSVSHANFIPSWETMCKIGDIFFREDETIMQLHPKESEYVNTVSTCLHLWRPTLRGVEIPMPPSEVLDLEYPLKDGKPTFNMVDHPEWQGATINYDSQAPSWNSICEVKKTVFGGNMTAMQLQGNQIARDKIQILTPKQIEIPTPPSILVGIKGLELY